MMSYEQWLEYILEIVRAIASREHQEKVWLGPRLEIDWVGDLYNALDEEFFEGFFRGTPMGDEGDEGHTKSTPMFGSPLPFIIGLGLVPQITWVVIRPYSSRSA
jgi:hypothetical protein